MVTREDINNEARAISKIRASGGHRNIVEVLHHGWLPTFSSYYFVDMEFCDKNLDDYIQSLAQHSRLPIQLLRTLPKDEYPQPRAFFRSIMDLIFGVGMDFIRGIGFLHCLKEVHRDLKPENGILLTVSKADDQSSILCKSLLLEARRLWDQFRRDNQTRSGNYLFEGYSVLSSP